MARHRRRAQRNGRLGRGSRSGRLPYRRRLRFEPLEDRRLLTITVNTLVDENDGTGDGEISLRDAIGAAMPGETINFSVAGTINLAGVAFGPLVIEKDLTIEGPGADQLTINGGEFSRIFTIDDNSNGTLAEVMISGLTLTGGLASGSGDGSDGGAIFSRENLTISDSILTGNTASDDGGAVYVDAGILTVQRSSLTGNTAGDLGGGIATMSSTLQVIASTIAGNHANDGGGGGIYSDGDTTIDSSTISGNTTAGFGGGVVTGIGDVFILQSTISGNMADGGAGGVLIASAGTAEIRHSTITGNTADADNDPSDFEGGGGILAADATVTLDHTIVAGNTDNTGQAPDIGSIFNAPFDISYSIIGDDTGGDVNDVVGNLIGTSGSPVDPQLEPLADNGGPTQTHALMPGSPALDGGDADALPSVGGVPAFDQRGEPLVRVFDGDGVGGARIDVGAHEQIGLVVVDTLGDVSNGNYFAGDLTLREAIAIANANGGDDTIVFAPTLTNGGAAEIDLSQGELLVTDGVSIQGPGASVLTINGNFIDRVMHFSDDNLSTFFDAELSGLTITGGGGVPTGAGIFSAENLSISDSVITGNLGANHGGGLYLRNGSHALIRSTVSGNVTNTTSGGIFHYRGTLMVSDSTITGNETDGSGGGILSLGADETLIINSTISGNSAGLEGGGITNAAGLVVIRHSTITNNTAPAGSGSGMAWSAISETTFTEVYSSIVAGNANNDDVRLLSGMLDSIDSLGYNVIGGGNAVSEFGATGDQTGVFDPGLGLLDENGGRTRTHALLVGSPAIDAGNPADAAGAGDVPEFDQRGDTFGRVIGGAIDVGAFESQFVPPELPGDYNLNGTVDAADYVLWRKTDGSVVPAYDGADGSGNGMVGPEDYGIWRANFGRTSPPSEGSGASGADLVAVAATDPQAVEETPVRIANPEEAPRLVSVTGALREAPVLQTETLLRSPWAREVSSPACTSQDAALVAWLSSRELAARDDVPGDAIYDATRGAVGHAEASFSSTLDRVFETVGRRGALALLAADGT